MKKIRKDLVFIISSVILLIFPLTANEEPLAIRGESPCPMINADGDLTFIYKNQEGGISLATQKIHINDFSIQDIFQNPDVYSPVIKHDRFGDTWAVWRQENSEESHIFAGKLKENTLLSQHILSRGRASNYSPDFTFDAGNNLWVTWIEYSDGKFRVLVKNVNTGEVWLVNSPLFSGAYIPKIIADRNNRLWIFWVGRDTGRDEIFYSYYNGMQWALPSSLNRDNSYPHILPDVYIGYEGFPWIVWTAYDGNDYEIYRTRWDGRDWTDEEKITENSEMDSSPALSFVSGDIPIIVWSRSNGEWSGIYCTYQLDSGWSEEIEISRSYEKLNKLPKIAVQQDKIGITWQSGEIIQSTFLLFGQLMEKHPLESQAVERKSREHNTAANAPLSKNEYIGFGNSITLGKLDDQIVPEKGYVPRLEALLDEYFGDSIVINEGWGGEVTREGFARIDHVLAVHLSQYLLLMEGTNDVIFIEISMDTTSFNLEQMIQKSKNIGTSPLLSTIIPRNDWRWDVEFYKDRIFDLNDKIRVLATELTVPLVDQFNSFYYYQGKGGDDWKSLLCTDNIHPNEKGYQVMAETWFEEIKTLPLSPVITEVKRTTNEILFFTQEGNSVIWQDNPKLSEEGSFTEYKIYRSDGTDEPYDFYLLAVLPITTDSAVEESYFDTDITVSHRYTYAVSLVREDGVESPLSEYMNDL